MTRQALADVLEVRRRLARAAGIEDELDRQQEQRVRRMARRQGYTIRRSRRALSYDQQGQFMVAECASNTCVLGNRYDATLDEIEIWLKEE